MPLIDVFYPSGTFTPEARTELADELTTVMLRAERAPETEFFRTITWVHVHEQPEGTMLAAGRPVEKPVFRVQATRRVSASSLAPHPSRPPPARLRDVRERRGEVCERRRDVGIRWRPVRHRLEAERVHPLRVQLRDRGAARRPVVRADPGRQGTPRLARIQVQQGPIALTPWRKHVPARVEAL